MFLFQHLLVTSFTVPQITNRLIGHMDIVIAVQITFVCVAVASCGLFRARYKQTPATLNPHFKVERNTRLLFLFTTLLLCGVLSRILNCSQLNLRLSKQVPPQRTIRMMSYNVLLGRQLTGRDNTACVSEVIEHYRPSILALQESDPLPAFLGGKDLLGALQSRFAGSGYTSHQGVEPMKSSISVAVVTSLTMVSHSAHLLAEGLPNTTPIIRTQ